MSLDVSLIEKEPVKKSGTGVYVRENGATRELTADEVTEKFPNAVDVSVSEYKTHEVYTTNITHNLSKMADEADLYYALWRPDERGWTHAHHIIPLLTTGLWDLKKNPDHFKKFNPENGWGSYEGLVEFVENYLNACKEYPNAEIEISR